MQTKKLECRSCGASISLARAKQTAHCTYCGATVVLDAKLVDSIAQEREKRENSRKLRRAMKIKRQLPFILIGGILCFLLACITVGKAINLHMVITDRNGMMMYCFATMSMLFAVSLILLFVEYYGELGSLIVENSNLICSSKEFTRMTKRGAEACVNRLGFVNIDCIPVSRGIKFWKPRGMVKSVSIRGKRNFKRGHLFEKSDLVLIYYYD